MHPAVSVILFTVTSGAGFGLIAWIGAGVPMPEQGLGAFLVAALAVALAAGGLVASTFHLGRPERAWRAFSQWRSSWLSREGIAAVATLLLFGIYALAWIFAGVRFGVLGYAVTAGALSTVFTTSMIYAQLKTVPHWNTWLTPACYLLFSLAAGFLAAGVFAEGASAGAVAAVLLVVAWGAKALWWRNAVASTLAARGSTPETATGLGFIGTVRLLEKPHSGESYLTREMAHRIGRKHAAKLRIIGIVLGCAMPLALALLVAAGASSLLFGVAFVSLLAGLFAERWLFFAEARHAVSLYYGGED